MSDNDNNQGYDLDNEPGENDETRAPGDGPKVDGIGEPDAPPSPPPHVEVIRDADDGSASDSDARIWAMLVHLAGLAGYIPVIPLVGMVAGPLIVWAIKKNDMPFVDQQGKEALNFQLTMFIVLLVLSALSLIPLVFCVTVPLAIVAVIIHFVLTLIGAIQANDGKSYIYPFRIQFFT